MDHLTKNIVSKFVVYDKILYYAKCLFINHKKILETVSLWGEMHQNLDINLYFHSIFIIFIDIYNYKIFYWIYDFGGSRTRLPIKNLYNKPLQMLIFLLVIWLYFWIYSYWNTKVGLKGENLELNTEDGSRKAKWIKFTSPSRPLRWYKVRIKL